MTDAPSLAGRLRAATDRLPAHAEGAAAAAVLVLADPGQEGVPLLFIRRSQRVPSHRGQIAFPGGGVRAGDADPAATALREAHEELAVDPDEVEVLGALPAVSTATGARRLVPVVGLARSTPRPRADAFEVAEWFWVRLDRLLATAPTSRRILPVADAVVHFYEVDGRVIWGATGAIVHELLERVRR